MVLVLNSEHWVFLVALRRRSEVFTIIFLQEKILNKQS